MLHRLPTKDFDKAKSLFESHARFTPIMFAALKQKRGRVMVDSLDSPKVAWFSLKIISAVAGDTSSDAASEIIENFPPHHVIVIPNDAWMSLVKSIWGDELNALKRTSMSHSTLDINHIRSLKKPLPEGFSLQKVDLESIKSIEDEMLTMHIDLFFDTPENFVENGIGFCIKHGEKVVSMASTFTPFIDEFEIEIDTLDSPEYRRKGFATIAGAALIEYALENGLTPFWDAQTEISVELAKKLGYSQPDSYNVYYRKKPPTPVDF
ncbi:MAG: GNAT family N-acetyltransferase [Candidatus Thorarchaeota archaeon]|jgi:GNAT superfamily N-acetyltransferase